VIPPAVEDGFVALVTRRRPQTVAAKHWKWEVSSSASTGRKVFANTSVSALVASGTVA
jgi:hypothetical protein